jgi:hypothetical protein
MMTSATGSKTASGTAAQAALAKDAAGKSAGYGLPCAKCRLYYPANLDRCPTCNHNERVSPTVPKRPPRPAEMAAEPAPDNSVLEKEREEFLRQFKSQLMDAHSEVTNAPEATCKFGEHHEGDAAHAEICSVCYERLQERLDVFEAAFHIDLKDAAQIIYDAVWADPSDPNKTYQNAAAALLTELRKRAGVTGMAALLGPFQPLEH